MGKIIFDKVEEKSYNNYSKLVNGACSSNDLLTMKEAEEFLRIKRTSLYKLIYSCELASFKIGRRRFVHKEDLDNFIKRKRAEFMAREI